jgi:hypothetical protein
MKKSSLILLLNLNRFGNLQLHSNSIFKSLAVLCLLKRNTQVEKREGSVS